MGWLDNLWRRRAAKAYVFKLGPWLRRAYGASRTYTADQIARGVRELNLDPRRVIFGHAVFLDAADFESIYGVLPNPVTMEEARAALGRDFGGSPRFDPSDDRIGHAERLQAWGLQQLSDHGSGHHAATDGGHGGGEGGGHSGN